MRAHVVRVKNQYYIFDFSKFVCIRKMRPRCRVEKANKPLCALIGVPDSVAPHPCPLCGEKNPRIGFSLHAKACRFLPPVAGSNVMCANDFLLLLFATLTFQQNSFAHRRASTSNLILQESALIFVQLFNPDDVCKELQNGVG